MVLYPYQPDPGSGVVSAPNAAAVDVAVKKGCRQVCITNLAATVLYVRIAGAGDSSAAEQAILGSTHRIFSKDSDLERISLFCAGVGSANVTSGNGMT